jgi:hypothetical protein
MLLVCSLGPLGPAPSGRARRGPHFHARLDGAWDESPIFPKIGPDLCLSVHRCMILSRSPCIPGRSHTLGTTFSVAGARRAPKVVVCAHSLGPLGPAPSGPARRGPHFHARLDGAWDESPMFPQIRPDLCLSVHRRMILSCLPCIPGRSHTLGTTFSVAGARRAPKVVVCAHSPGPLGLAPSGRARRGPHFHARLDGAWDESPMFPQIRPDLCLSVHRRKVLSCLPCIPGRSHTLSTTFSVAGARRG